MDGAGEGKGDGDGKIYHFKNRHLFIIICEMDGDDEDIKWT